MRSLSCGLILTVLLAAPRPTLADDFKLEPGYTLLFNGKDLSGWKEKTGGASLDGKTEAYKGRFKVVDGVLVIDPKVKNDVRIETQKKFAGDVHIKFDFKPDAKCNNDLFLRGTKYDIVKGAIKNFKEGEWHQFEIILKGDKAEYKCNGVPVGTRNAKAGATPFEVRAEFGAIELRNIRYKEGE